MASGMQFFLVSVFQQYNHYYKESLIRDKISYMRNKFFYIVLFLFASVMRGQYNEIGISFGGANPISDIGSTYYVYPTKPAIGFLYKRNLRKQLSLRADIKWFHLWDNDSRATTEARRARDFSFDNRMVEMGAGVEYDFLHFDTHEPFKLLFTPYMHTGFYYFKMDRLYFDNLTLTGQEAKHLRYPERAESWAIPFTLGVKTRLWGSRFLVGAEVSLRYTFTNNLEGSKSPKGEWFGNLNTNDWYMVSGFYLTYTFGAKKCNCFEFAK
jgi:hypothetical protein